jgi:hypothetical protein
MKLLGEEWVRAIKKSTSQYVVSIGGAVSVGLVEKIKEKWWYGTFLSCLGWSELVLFEIGLEGENNSLQVEVFGRKNGKIVTGMI